MRCLKNSLPFKLLRFRSNFVCNEAGLKNVFGRVDVATGETKCLSVQDGKSIEVYLRPKGHEEVQWKGLWVFTDNADVLYECVAYRQVDEKRYRKKCSKLTI